MARDEAGESGGGSEERSRRVGSGPGLWCGLSHFLCKRCQSIPISVSFCSPVLGALDSLVWWHADSRSNRFGREVALPGARESDGREKWAGGTSGRRAPGEGCAVAYGVF